MKVYGLMMLLLLNFDGDFSISTLSVAKAERLDGEEGEGEEEEGGFSSGFHPKKEKDWKKFDHWGLINYAP